MGNVAANVQVATTGGVYAAIAGTALPTNATTGLIVAYGELGYLSEAGIVETINETSTNIKAWQNNDVVRVVTTEHLVTYALTMIETNARTVKEFYGNYAAGVTEINGEPGTRHPWVFEVYDGPIATGEHRRIVIPDGQITQRGAVTYANGQAVSYPITITAYPDADGTKAYIYFDEDAVSA